MATTSLDLTVSPEALTATLVDIPSVSGNEQQTFLIQEIYIAHFTTGVKLQIWEVCL